MAEDANKTVRQIKKYKNRRLYDLDRSQYITIEELQAYVLQDVDFKVVDATNGKDLTNQTLLQIFVELETHSTQALSPNVLRQLIKLANHPLSQQYKTMLEQVLTHIQDHLHPYANTLQDTTELWKQQTETLMKSWQDLFRNRG